MKISGNIITLNEEKNIEQCVESLRQVCDEIVVVDSGSSDRTVEIAKSLGAIVIHQPYLGDGIQKNVALTHVSNDWILSLDADERLTAEMVQAIKSLDLENSDIDAYAFRRKNMIGSRWIKYCGWYPDYCTRLYNKKTARFADVKQHAKVVSRNTRLLDVDFYHYSFMNVGELFSKSGRNYSNRSAKIMFQQGKRANSFSPFLHGLSAFLKAYVFKRGFLQGVDGFSVALSSSLNSYLKYARLLEFQKDPEVLRNEDFNKIW